jgi:cytochrome b6-f complex iron-sulfur subunit
MEGTSSNSHGCATGACRRDNVGLIDSDALTGVDRRGFIVQGALLAAAAALAACGVSSDLSAPTLPTTGNTIDVTSLPTLSAVGGIAMISIGGVALAIVRTGTSSFVALSRICPHQGGTVQQSGNGFQCPVHGATFSQTGQWVGGQRTSSLHAYVTAYDATAGTLTIT